MTLDEGKQTKNVLAVGFPYDKARMLQTDLQEEGYQIYWVEIDDELTPEMIVEAVEDWKPELLMIDPYPPSDSPLIDEATDSFKPEGEYSPIFRRSVGIEAVELLRRESEIPVLYTPSDPMYLTEDKVMKRIIRTYPKGLVSPFGNMAIVRDFIHFCVETWQADEQGSENPDALEAQRMKSTEALLRFGLMFQQKGMESDSYLESFVTRENQMRAIFDCSSEAIFLKNTDLEYLIVNTTMAKLLRKELPAIQGKTDKDLYAREYAEHFKSVELRVLEGKPIVDQYTRPVGGLEMTFVFSRVPLRNDEGRIIGIYGISRDITHPLPVPDEYPSRAMKECLEIALKAAEGDSVVLLLGETGSGKDYLARYIHDHSRRSKGPYFSINCAAIAPNLAESELFGHERGAFTGAVGRKPGMLELAENGTLLLNEIGELAPPLQAKLLTFLDTKKFTRVGGQKEVSVNARIIAATNRDLEKETERGGFREDLFYRLNVMSIKVPSLRDRREEIPKLVQEIIAELCARLQFSPPPDVSPQDMEKLKKYHWPGNVRDLSNVLERALILSGGSSVDIPELGSPHDHQSRGNRRSLESALPHDLGDSPLLERAISSFERYEPSQQMQKPTKLKKPTPEQLAMIYERCLKEGPWTRADVAKVFGRKPSTVSKWLSNAGYPVGEQGRPSGGAKNLEQLRVVIEEIMR